MNSPLLSELTGAYPAIRRGAVCDFAPGTFIPSYLDQVRERWMSEDLESWLALDSEFWHDCSPDREHRGDRCRV